MSSLQFIRESLNTQRRARGEAELSGAEFIKLARAEAAELGMDAEMLKRPVNVGFSGGEKKRAEMVQMGIMRPRFAVLDETDSGLDIDALRTVGAGINRIMRAPDKGVLLITHYQRLLDYVKPDKVHVLSKGRIVRSRRAGTGPRAGARRLCGGGGVRRLATLIALALAACQQAAAPGNDAAANQADTRRQSTPTVGRHAGRATDRAGTGDHPAEVPRAVGRGPGGLRAIVAPQPAGDFRQRRSAIRRSSWPARPSSCRATTASRSRAATQAPSAATEAHYSVDATGSILTDEAGGGAVRVRCQ